MNKSALSIIIFFLVFLAAAFSFGGLETSPPPSAPIANNTTNTSGTSFTASWSLPSGATSFRLDVSTSSSFFGFVSGYNDLVVSTTSQNVTGLTSGTVYYYRVRAVNSSGTSGNSNTVTVYPMPPAPTANAASNIGANSVTANWSTVSLAQSYRLDVATNSSFTNFVSGYNNLTVAGTSQTITGLNANATYYYRVRSVNTTGTSSHSNTVSVTTILPVPDPPVAAAATSITGTSFQANWSLPLHATSFRLDVSTSSDFSGFVAGYGNLTVGSTSQSVTGLNPNSIYYYRVRAVNSSGTSGNSNTITVYPMPPAPTANAATSIGATSLVANWTSVFVAQSYRLDVATNSSFTNIVSGYNNLTVAGTSHTVTGLNANSTYYYRVRAVNTTGTSSSSNVTSATTLLPIPDPPVAASATSITGTSFQANWSSPLYATSFRLDVSTSNSFAGFISNYGDLTVGTTSQSVTGLTDGNIYYYRVRAVNSSGTSGNSNITTVYPVPPAPQVSSATAITTTSFTANWSNVPVATSYRLDVSDNNFSSFILQDYSLTGTSHTITGLTPGRTYYYRVRAVNPTATSSNSATSSFPLLCSPPSTAAASSITSTSFVANWASVYGATSYALDVSTSSGFGSYVSGYNGLSIVTTNHLVSGLSPATTYYYRVRAVNSSGTSINSGAITTSTILDPPTIQAGSTIAANSFTANWSAVSGATGYSLDVSTSSSFNPLVTGYNGLSVSGTSFLVSNNISSGVTYYYRVRATKGGVVSANSGYTSVLTKPAAPTAAAATNIAATAFQANWSLPVGATSFRLDVSTSSSFDGFVSGYANVVVNTTSYSVNGLTAGVIYYYRVRAVNVSGESVNSNTISVYPMPSAPVVNAATSITATSFIANWSSVSVATSYRLDVSEDNFSTFVTGFNNQTVNSINQVVTGLTSGKTYYYRVRAVNPTGTSGNSLTVSFPILCSAPIATTATNISASAFTANWQITTGATSYQLDVSTSSTFANFISGYNSLSVTGTSHVVTGSIAGSVFYYRVRAVNSSGVSNHSNTIALVDLPVAPTTLFNSNIQGSSAVFNWLSVAGASNYQLDVSTSSTFSSFLPSYNNKQVFTNNESVVGLAPGATYYYRVRTVNAAGTSENSSVHHVTIPIVFPGQNESYVVSNEVLVRDITSINAVDALSVQSRKQTVQYFDGLGRPIQSVSTKGSANQLDLVVPIKYDNNGREARKYLPFTNGSNGWLKPLNGILDTSGNYIGDALGFYTNPTDKVVDDTRPFTETIFEASPLNRPIRDYGSGVDWSPVASGGYDKPVQHFYIPNNHGTGPEQEKIISWAISYDMPIRSSFNAGFVEFGGYYSSGQISIKRTLDEDSHEIREYIDKSGRLILRKNQVSVSTDLNNTNDWALTYYIYDDHGNLRFVLPPELSKLIHNNGDYFNVSQTELDKWAFQYKYDARNRMTQKKVPGASEILMVYDNRNRLILTQDGNQRGTSPHYWSFIKYDQLNRPILTGIKDTTVSQSQMQTIVDLHFSKSSARWSESYIGNVAGNVHGYTNLAYPVLTGSTPNEVDPNKYLTVTYYDNYDFKSLWSDDYHYLNENLSEVVNGITYQQQEAENLHVLGQVTGTKTKVLDGGVTGGTTWLKGITYYDDKYRVIQTVADNYKGGTDRVTNVFDFVGKVLESKVTHSESDLIWRDLLKVRQEGNKIISTYVGSTWGNSGLASVQQLPVGQNGWVEFVYTGGNTERMVGLSDNNTNAHYNTIDYAIYLSNPIVNPNAKVYENGVIKYTIPIQVKVGDVIRIERTGTSVVYKINSATQYTSTVASNTILMADVSFNYPNSSVTGVRASFATNTKTIALRFEYDHAGRLLKTWHKFDSHPEILLALNEYNDLGQLVDKKLHSTISTGNDAKQSIDYRYNIRGWLTSMNDASLSNTMSTTKTNDDYGDLYGMNLTYNSTDLEFGNIGLYNGNISGMAWSNHLATGTIKQNGYIYSYDALNRIKTSSFKEKSISWTSPANNALSETGFNYDLNGNITTLQRNDKRASGWMDNLTYYYEGNKLERVTDSGDDFAGFIDGQPGTQDDYRYDYNGNLTYDLNKGIGTFLGDATNLIAYNFLNLPETVTKGSNSIRYIYDASGRKLAQITTYGDYQKRLDYVGELQYENDNVQFISHEEGRIAIASNKTLFTHAGDVLTNITAATSMLSTLTQNGQSYVRATATGSSSKQGMFPIGGTIAVQGGEQYLIRAKGYWTGTYPVYLNIRTNGIDLNWPGATLPNGMTAEAYTEQTITVPIGHTTLQAGVIWNAATNAHEFFLNDFEIIKLASNATPEYQYNLKDHLGNVRLTFTTKVETDDNIATLETANLPTEQSQFLRIENAKRINSSLFDRTNGSAPTTTTGYAQRLNGSTNEKYGLAKSLSVMPGDTINAEVYVKYVDPNTSNWTGALTTLMSQIAANTAGIVVDGTTYSTSTSSFPGGFMGLVGTTDNGAPRAYLNWLIFDRNFVFLTGGFKQLTTAAKETGIDIQHERLFNSSPIVISQPGYVYIYLSNESISPVEVFFDDFKVTHAKSPILQTDDYYPFGLTFNSYNRENSTENRYLYNQGTGEKTFKTERILDLGLNVDLSRDRVYDYLTGRWWQLDPKAEQGGQESWSPNHFSFNNPIRYNDPFGDCPECEMADVVAATVSNVLVGAYNIFVSPFNHKEASNDADGISIQISERQDPKTISEAFLKTAGNGLAASSLFTGGSTQLGFLAKNGVGTGLRTTGGDILQNAAKGKAFENSVVKQVTEQGTNVAQQVTVKANNGVRTKLDIVTNQSGKPALTELKSSETAKLTDKQKLAFPSIQQSGGTIMGNKAKDIGFPAGTVIGPTPVPVVRPSNLPEWLKKQ